PQRRARSASPREAQARQRAASREARSLNSGQFGEPVGEAGLTTPSAPPACWLSAHILLRLRPVGLALRALLCEEGNGCCLHFFGCCCLSPRSRAQAMSPAQRCAKAPPPSAP